MLRLGVSFEIRITCAVWGKDRNIDIEEMVANVGVGVGVKSPLLSSI